MKFTVAKFYILLWPDEGPSHETSNCILSRTVAKTIIGERRVNFYTCEIDYRYGLDIIALVRA